MYGIPLSFGSSAATSIVAMPWEKLFNGSELKIDFAVSAGISRQRSVSMTVAY
jgi:hypothetical protein